MVVLDVTTLNEIKLFIKNYEGLTIDCEMSIRSHYPKIDPLTLGSIVNKEAQQRMKENYGYMSSKRIVTKICKEFTETATLTHRDDILLNIAIRLKVSPIGMCRIVLSEMYKYSKSEINEMLRNPNLIDNNMLAVNVSKCLMNDIQEGPVTDLIRRCIGEEYEVKLKEMAQAAGMVFYDEWDLRRTGFDKTPDLKLAIPCLYKGKPIQWIESKACFGDADVHHRYIKEQLASYRNRFGAGIVIYWFGYVEGVSDCRDNDEEIIVLDGFPDSSDLEFLDFGGNSGNKK